jgi:DNA-binding transcriptional MerR regulator
VFRIATFARIAGVSAKVLRDYDRLGLFRPAWVDPETRYRMYSPAQLPELRLILALRDLGVGLPEIDRLLHEGVDLRSTLEQRQRELERARREVERRLAALHISLTSGESDVVVRDVPAELVATLDVEAVGGDVARAFYELELAIQRAGIRAARPPGELVDGNRTTVFVPVRRADPRLEVRRLPRVRAATILHRGSYATVPASHTALSDWVAASGSRPTGELRVLYLQFGAERDLRLPREYLVHVARDLVTELQIPIDPS